VDQDEDVGAGVAAADADVVQPAVVPQGEHSAGVDPVVSDALGPPSAWVTPCSGGRVAKLGLATAVARLRGSDEPAGPSTR